MESAWLAHHIYGTSWYGLAKPSVLGRRVPSSQPRALGRRVRSSQRSVRSSQRSSQRPRRNYGSRRNRCRLAPSAASAAFGSRQPIIVITWKGGSTEHDAKPFRGLAKGLALYCS
jgi:hypothetical protein